MKTPRDGTQTIRSLYEAFARRDTQTVAALLDPQIEWTSAENFIYSDHSPYLGVDAVLKLIFGRLLSDWDKFSMAPSS